MDDMDQDDYRPRREREIPYRGRGVPPRSSRYPTPNRHSSPAGRDYPLHRRDLPPRKRYIPEEVYDNDEYEYTPPRKRPRRKRSFWPAFFTGCAVAIFLVVLAAAAFIFFTLHVTPGGNLKSITGLGTTQSYSQSIAQQLQLSTLSQLQVCDRIGNINISVDPQASQASITTKKTVRATSQNEANQIFKQINIETQPPGTIQRPLNCARFAPPATPTTGTTQGNTGSGLIVNVTIPNSSGLMPSTDNSVDVIITLPPGVLPQNGPSLFLDVESSVGNITVSGLSGQLNIKGSNGNIVVDHAYLTSASDIETGEGNINFSGRLIIPNNGSTQANFKLSSEKGTLNISLPDTTNVLLDANTNAGKIKGDFNLKAQTEGEASQYQGPLIVNNGTPNATLVADVSLGDIIIQKQQA